MAWYPYSYKTAFDPLEREVAPIGSVGEVFAVGDTGFTTPLQPYDLSGLPVALAVQNDAGYIPSFQVEDHTSVIWKSGEYVLELVTSMPLPGPTGAKIVNATDNGDGTMTFELSDGSTVGPINVPEGPPGDRGPAGYNATGAVQDMETLAAYVNKQAGPNPVSDALDKNYGAVVNVERFGAVGDGVADDTQAILNAAAAAAGGTVMLPARKYNVGTGLKLAGLDCAFIGQDPDAKSLRGTTIVALDQSGPALDFTDYNWPTGYRSAINFRGFFVKGSGVADPTKANSGIRILGVKGGNNGGAGSAVWSRIVVSDTGGPCIEADRAYLHDFSNIRLVKPVEAKANDVPYFIGRNMSGCNLQLDLYSPNTTGADDCGVSGAVILTDDAEHASTKNRLDIRAENLHPPTGGTIIHCEANENFIELRHFDCYKEAGATETSFIRLYPPPTFADYGGSEIVGQIPGDNGAANAVDYGVDVGQSRNSIVGVKGFRGNNVRIRDGITNTYVNLRGARAAATDPGIIDEALDGSNTLLDYVYYPGLGYKDTARKTIDTVINNTTVSAADPELQVQVVKNAVYAVEAVMLYNSSTTADFKAGLTTPAGAVVTAGVDGLYGGTVGATNTNLTRAILPSGNAAMGGGGEDALSRISGTITTGSTAGTVSVRWGQLTAEATDTIMRAGSFLRVSRIA